MINVGCGKGVTVSKLVDTIGKITGRQLEPIYNTAQTGGVRRMRADLTRASTLLDFTPQTSLEEGLRLTLQKDLRLRDL